MSFKPDAKQEKVEEFWMYVEAQENMPDEFLMDDLNWLIHRSEYKRDSFTPMIENIIAKGSGLSQKQRRALAYHAVVHLSHDFGWDCDPYG